MARTAGPYAKVECRGCKREIEVQVSERKCRDQMDALRDSRDFKCAECASALTK